MIIYAITSSEYAPPVAYYTNKATAQWDLENKIEFDKDLEYIIEIEVVE
jgi:hypothetical protein